MNLKKYNKLIDKIARGLHNETIKQEQIKKIIEDELGTTSSESSEKYIRKSPEEYLKWKQDNEIRRQNLKLYRAFIDLWLCTSEVEKNPTPFTIKYNSKKIIEHLAIIKSFKENKYYNRTLLEAINWVKTGMEPLTINSEHIKMVSLKYL